jgi:hypothetical protein
MANTPMKKRRKSSTKNPMAHFLGQLGLMRLVLVCTALALIIFVPAPGTPPVYRGLGLIPTVLVPVLAPLLFMVLMLEVLMAGVFMIDKRGAARARYRGILLLNLALAVALVLFWIPYFKALIP